MNTEKPRSKLSLNRENRNGAPQIEERLHKVLANAGLGSRRLLEERIEAGEVRVNGETANIGSSVHVGDRVELDGKAFVTVAAEPEEVELLMYHKPEGEVTTHDDPEGRKTVFERLPRLKGARWVSVGRLDINTTGLLLVTTDGELANALMHPSREVEREYVCRIHGTVEPEMLEQLKRGVELEDGPAKFDEIAVINLGESHSWFRVTLREGRNREVRRIWEAVGLTVSRLKRIRYGSIELPRDLRRGHHRALGAEQVVVLRRELGLGDVPQALTLQPVIGVRRAAKSTEFKPGSQRAWSGGHADEARELRAFDHVREEPSRGNRNRRGKKGGRGGANAGGPPRHHAPTAPGGVPSNKGRRRGASGPRPGEAWTPNTEALRTMTAHEKSHRPGSGDRGNFAGGRGAGGGGRGATGADRGPGGAGRGPGGGGRGPAVGRGQEGNRSRGGGVGGPGGGGRQGSRGGGNASPYGFPSDHAYAQRQGDNHGNRAPSAPGGARRGRGRNRPRP